MFSSSSRTCALGSLVLAAFLVVISFLLVILGCTIVPERNALPLLPLFLTLCTPLPFVLCGRASNEFSEESAINGAGHFFGGAVAVSGPALACVLLHTTSISTQAFYYSLTSEVFLGLATVILVCPPSVRGRDEVYDF